MSDPVLKPCPFCGHAIILAFKYTSGAAFFCECQQCAARTPMVGLREVACERWNRRHIPDPNDAQVETVAEAIENIYYKTQNEVRIALSVEHLQRMARAAIRAMHEGGE